jgi:hypothetical protein
MRGWKNNEPSECDRQSSFVFVMLAKKVSYRLFSKPIQETPVNWREIMTDVCARFFVGLVMGLGLCVLLVPAVLWPSRRNPHSLFEQVDQTHWISWLFVTALIGPAIVGVLTTKLHQHSSRNQFFGSGADLDDRVKTGCMGILLPLALAAYGVHRILHPIKLNRFTGRLMETDDVVSLGICALGMALFAHGWGFVPYTRIPFLKYLVMGLGVVAFVYGLSWANRGN